MNEPGKNPDLPSGSIGSSERLIPIVDAQLVSSGPSEIIDAELVEPDAQASTAEPIVPEVIESPTDSQPIPRPDVQSIVDLSNVERSRIGAPPVIVQPTASDSENGDTGNLDSALSHDQTGIASREQKSWIFRCAGAVGKLASNLFGIVSIILLLAVAACIPIVQLLSFGYLLEVSGRLARQQSIRDAMIGLNKASKLGGIVLGTWITLLPIRFLSELWHEAYLIDPTSGQTQAMRIVQIIFISLAILHIAAAWTCGGKLRYFFWPIVAPFSFGIWLARRTAGSSVFRKLLSITLGWLSPHLVNDICNAKPISDWFLPAIFFKRLTAGNLYSRLRDAVWDFATSLNLKYYFVLGLKGFIGSFAWLFFPTLLLVIASYTEDGAAILSGLFGVVFAIPIFAMLPFLQAHFAKDGKLTRFIELRAVFKNFGRAPFAHIFALLLTLVLALPLFFLKIEEIPHELLWTLSVVFIMFSWPARMSLGWAYQRGAKRDRSSRWWIRYPLFLLAAPIALAFALILTLTRYVSWNGALSLFENHVFLLPAPFWM